MAVTSGVADVAGRGRSSGQPCDAADDAAEREWWEPDAAAAEGDGRDWRRAAAAYGWLGKHVLTKGTAVVLAGLAKTECNGCQGMVIGSEAPAPADKPGNLGYNLSIKF